MNPSATTALVVLVGVVALFAVTIYFSLRFRKRNFAKGLELKAADVWPQFQNDGFELSGLLYGVWQDFSSTEFGMIVKDCNDQQAARIVYHTGRRLGWITIETSAGNFVADVLPTLRQSVALRSQNDGSQSLCDFSRLTRGTYRFDAKSFGILESEIPRGLRLAPVFRYMLNGVPVGTSCHIGGWRNLGRMVVLSHDLPLSIRLFVLAMQGQRV